MRRWIAFEQSLARTDQSQQRHRYARHREDPALHIQTPSGPPLDPLWTPFGPPLDPLRENDGAGEFSAWIPCQATPGALPVMLSHLRSVLLPGGEGV
eukprot:8939544-Pyramimonas_sp.AAC.2